MVTLQQGLDEVRRITPHFQDAGWILGVYGSVIMRGEGNDIDLIAVPVVYYPESPATLMSRLYNIYSDPYRGILETEAWSFTHHNGVQIDIQFRFTPNFSFSSSNLFHKATA
jgi:hypothetical protein